jgi:hypothetical protein
MRLIRVSLIRPFGRILSHMPDKRSFGHRLLISSLPSLYF